MRITDIMMTFPFFRLFVFIVFYYGPSLVLLTSLVIGLTGWTGVARLVRSDALFSEDPGILSPLPSPWE